jgi:antitoxin (DNA-binding transcriptional repressor) of toxin-antitoxin stability system
MEEISIQELHRDTGQWVRLAAGHERIVITDGGQPIAALTAFEESQLYSPLPDREERVKQRSPIKVDSPEYISEMRGW